MSMNRITLNRTMLSSISLEYGNVIKISDSNSVYEGKYFFVC